MKSCSAAARQLDVAPSSVSRQINDLKEDPGARLFARTTRKLSLTEAGQIYYERSSNIVGEVDEAIPVGRQKDSSFKARKIGESRRFVCASPEYLKKAGVPKIPEDLEHRALMDLRSFQ